MGYLLYVSHDAENLQFFLWLQDYTERFHAVSQSDQALSPPWEPDIASQPPGKELSAKSPDKKSSHGFDHTFDIPLNSMPCQPFGQGPTPQSAELANTRAGLKWQPCQCNRFLGKIY